MPRIKLFLMRHGKSCSNHMRHGPSGNQSDPKLVAISQGLRDPGLTVDGARTASQYGPLLTGQLRGLGFDVDHCLVGSSLLRRARETARLVFGRRPRTLPHFTENGKIPENTPAAQHYSPPNWDRVAAHLSTLVHDGQSVAIVSHGSFLGSLWPIFTGHELSQRLNNMDGILLDIEVSKHGNRVHAAHEIPCSVHVDPSIDKCKVGDRQKIATLRRSMAQQRKSRQQQQRQKNQRGGNGSAGMNPGYFTPGAQMVRTSPEPTGVGLAGVSDGWVRAPLAMFGGNRRRTQKQQRQQRQQKQRQQQQNGGFSASVMGAFAANGLKVLPGLAGFLGYRQYSNEQGQQQSRRRRRSQSRNRSRSQSRNRSN